MRSDLFDTLRSHCRARPIDHAGRTRIAMHMQACGIAAIADRGVLFERRGSDLKLFKLPARAAGEPIPL